MARQGTLRYGTAWYCTVRYGTVRYQLPFGTQYSDRALRARSAETFGTKILRETLLTCIYF